MVNYQKERVKLTNTQLRKLKTAAKNKKRAVLRLNMENVEDEELLHELWLTTWQSVKCNDIGNNTSTDIKLSKDQILVFFQGSETALWYQEARVKLTNKQLNKWKSAAKNKTGTILRLNEKNSEDEELAHELIFNNKTNN